MYNNDDSPGFHVFLLCIMLVVLLFISEACDSEHVSSERADANMVYIQQGYCYDADTKIIYRESIVEGGRYGYDTPVYSLYVNENGNYCKYERGRWIEFVKD